MKKLYLGFALLMGAFLPGCQPKDPQPVEEPVVLGNVDRIIDLPGTVDFSAVSQQGQGPKDKIIRRQSTVQTDGVSYYTYDDAGNLLGIYEPNSFGFDHYELGEYRDGLLQQVYQGSGPYKAPTAALVKPVALTKYVYNSNRQLIMAIDYINAESINQPGGPQKGILSQVCEFTYDGTGQLRTTRMTFQLSGLFPGGVREATWEKGNKVNESLSYSRSHFGRNMIQTIEYNQQPNPTIRFPSAYGIETVNQPIKTTETAWVLGEQSGTGRVEVREQEWRNDYDSQGRIAAAQARTINSSTGPATLETFWSGSRYTYSE